MERFTDRATCVEECEQCVQECARVLLSGIYVYTQTHVNAHLDTIDVIARTKYRRGRGHADFVAAHVSECFYTLGRVARQIALRVERFASQYIGLKPVE